MSPTSSSFSESDRDGPCEGTGMHNRTGNQGNRCYTPHAKLFQVLPLNPAVDPEQSDYHQQDTRKPKRTCIM